MMTNIDRALPWVVVGSDVLDPGQYVRGSRSSIGVHMRLGYVRVCFREVRDGYVTGMGIISGSRV